MSNLVSIRPASLCFNQFDVNCLAKGLALAASATFTLLRRNCFRSRAVSALGLERNTFVATELVPARSSTWHVYEILCET